MASHFSAFINFRVPLFVFLLIPAPSLLRLSLTLCVISLPCVGSPKKHSWDSKANANMSLDAIQCVCIVACGCVRISVYMYVGNSRKLSQVRHARRAASSFA